MPRVALLDPHVPLVPALSRGVLLRNSDDHMLELDLVHSLAGYGQPCTARARHEPASRRRYQPEPVRTHDVVVDWPLGAPEGFLAVARDPLRRCNLIGRARLRSAFLRVRGVGFQRSWTLTLDSGGIDDCLPSVSKRLRAKQSRLGLA